MLLSLPCLRQRAIISRFCYYYDIKTVIILMLMFMLARHAACRAMISIRRYSAAFTMPAAAAD